MMDHGPSCIISRLHPLLLCHVQVPAPPAYVPHTALEKVWGTLSRWLAGKPTSECFTNLQHPALLKDPPPLPG